MQALPILVALVLISLSVMILLQPGSAGWLWLALLSPALVLQLLFVNYCSRTK